MIDLSTLIALLTALASVTASSPPGQTPSRADHPPASHCSATAGPAGATRAGATHRPLVTPRTITLPAPPSDPAGPFDPSSRVRPESPTSRQLHSGADGNGDETDRRTTAPTPTTRSDEAEDESDSAANRQSSDRRPRGEESSPTTESRSSNESEPDSSDIAEDEPDTEAADTEQPNPTRESRGRDGHADEEADPRPDTSTPGTHRSPAPTGRPGERHTGDPTCGQPPGREPDREPDRQPDPADRPAEDPEVPSDLVDLGSWYLTLPTGAEGDPDTVQPAELTGYSSAYFRLNEERDGVVFTAPVAGATTRNSDYPRSELREMSGTEEAAWSNSSGTHTLRATEAVTELPEAKPELVTAQIHGGDDDIMQIRLEGSHLMVQYDDGAKQITLDPSYRLGAPYDIEIVAATNSVRVSYNGEQKAELPLSGSTWYFKAGAYVQSNPGKGDAAPAAGQVIIYSLEVDHT